MFVTPLQETLIGKKKYILEPWERHGRDIKQNKEHKLFYLVSGLKRALSGAFDNTKSKVYKGDVLETTQRTNKRSWR